MEKLKTWKKTFTETGFSKEIYRFYFFEHEESLKMKFLRSSNKIYNHCT